MEHPRIRCEADEQRDQPDLILPFFEKTAAVKERIILRLRRIRQGLFIIGFAGSLPLYDLVQPGIFRDLRISLSIRFFRLPGVFASNAGQFFVS